MPKPKGSKDPTVVEVCDPSSLPGRLKAVGGSRSDTWNNVIAHQTMQALWVKHSNEEQRKDQANAALSGLIGINPNDELEGMLAAQLVSCHNASMECYRRAMLSEQTFEGRRDNLNQANKLSRTYATIWRRSIGTVAKGSRKLRSNTSTFTMAAKPSSAMWGEGCRPNRRINPMHLDMHRAKRCGAQTRSGKPCQSPAMANGRC
jgi:hypothetical protein